MIPASQSNIFTPANINSPRPRKDMGKSGKKVERSSLMPPANRGMRVVPSLEALEMLIKRAVAALQEGIFWDRGSIINILC